MCLGELSFSVTEGKNLPGKPKGQVFLTRLKKAQKDRVAVLQATERTSWGMGKHLSFISHHKMLHYNVCTLNTWMSLSRQLQFSCFFLNTVIRGHTACFAPWQCGLWHCWSWLWCEAAPGFWLPDKTKGSGQSLHRSTGWEAGQKDCDGWRSHSLSIGNV